MVPAAGARTGKGLCFWGRGLAKGEWKKRKAFGEGVSPVTKAADASDQKMHASLRALEMQGGSLGFKRRRCDARP